MCVPYGKDCSLNSFLIFSDFRFNVSFRFVAGEFPRYAGLRMMLRMTLRMSCE